MGCPYLLVNVFIIMNAIQRCHVALIEHNNYKINNIEIMLHKNTIPSFFVM